MSSRASIFYKHGVHLFEECLDRNICLDMPLEEETLKENKDPIYHSFTMSIEDWREFAQGILDKCNELEEWRKRQ